MSYPDLQEHLASLDAKGLLLRIRHPINKDTEMHPLVRWQFRGGIPEAERKAFLFENVIDGRGRQYDMPVAVAALAASPQVYSVGLGRPIDEIPALWAQALAHAIEPVIVESGPVHEIVLEGSDLDVEGGGLLQLPVPISTPGFDNAPYTTCSHWFTKDPDTGVRNQGNYRGQIKAQRRVGMYAGVHQQIFPHWDKNREKGVPLEAALVVGAPPVVSYGTVQKVPPGVDEMGIAGGLAGEPIRLVRCKTVNIEVPDTAEIVIEGLINTEYVEPEGPFGESHGYLHPRTVSPFMEVTAITMKRRPVLCSFISQVTPSESSVIKKVGYEPLLLRYLRDTVGIKSVIQVAMHEPLTNLRKLVILQMRKPAEGDVWRALNSIANYQHGVGKVAIAVDEDIDPHNLDAVWWAICYRAKPHQDVLILPGRVKGHAPPFESEGQRATAKEVFYQPATDSGMLINAILKEPFPPISLPKREFMEHALELWNRLELPPLEPQAPWYGYSLGQWEDEWEEEAQLAVKSDYLKTGEKLAARRRKTE